MNLRSLLEGVFEKGSFLLDAEARRGGRWRRHCARMVLSRVSISPNDQSLVFREFRNEHAIYLSEHTPQIWLI